MQAFQARRNKNYSIAFELQKDALLHTCTSCSHIENCELFKIETRYIESSKGGFCTISDIHDKRKRKNKELDTGDRLTIDLHVMVYYCSPASVQNRSGDFLSKGKLLTSK